MAFYLTIRSDEACSRWSATDPLVAFLRGLSELRQTAPLAFEGAPGAPWVAVILAASERGNYASDGSWTQRVNVVELVCSDEGDPAYYEALAAKIAAFLGYEAVEEASGRRVWPPADAPRRE